MSSNYAVEIMLTEKYRIKDQLRRAGIRLDDRNLDQTMPIIRELRDLTVAIAAIKRVEEMRVRSEARKEMDQILESLDKAIGELAKKKPRGGAASGSASAAPKTTTAKPAPKAKRAKAKKLKAKRPMAKQQRVEQAGVDVSDWTGKPHA